MLSELYFGKISSQSPISIEMKIDSKTLFDSIQSSKQIDEKTIRHIIAWIKQQIENQTINKVSWVCSTDMLADVFTKKNANGDSLVRCITKGMIDMSES